jgi:hypothetical protein
MYLPRHPNLVSWNPSIEQFTDSRMTGGIVGRGVNLTLYAPRRPENRLYYPASPFFPTDVCGAGTLLLHRNDAESEQC